MTGHLLASAPLALLALAAVIRSSDGERSYHFSYNHNGEDWLEGECASRDRQSPIDFGKESPWDCNPPTLVFLRQFLGPKYFKLLGFGKLAGDPDDDADSDPFGTMDAGAAPGPAAAGAAPSPAAASLLELTVHEKTSQPIVGLVGGPAPGPAMFFSNPTPPPMFVPGCGTLGAFFFKYDKAEKPLVIQNNGHTISTDLKGHGLGSITHEGFIFDVLSVNFHVHSEHTFNGETVPLELHIVHRGPETDHVLVMAIPFKEVPSSSALLQRNGRGLRGSKRGGQPMDTALDRENARDIAEAVGMRDKEEDQIMPGRSDGPKRPKPSDPGFSEALANLITYPLPLDGEQAFIPLRAGPVDLITPLIGGATKMPQGFFQYRGSLTAPPCSESVTWLVRKEPLYAARSQIELLRMGIMQANSNFNNARSVMPLMGRHILYRLGINGNPPPPPERPVDPNFVPVERFVPFRGVTAAKEAIFKAMEAARAQGVLTDAVTAAQTVRGSASAAVNRGMAAQMGADSVIMTTPLPTPNPERLLSRMVDAVASQMDGSEKAAAMAAAVASAPEGAAR
jgi:hypothetical protein